MSIAFHEWHRLVQDPSITNQIKDNLNTLIDQQLKSALETNHDIASMISYLTIDQLSLGSAAPVIELMDLGYPDVNEEEECTDHEHQQQQQNNSNNDNRNNNSNSNNNMKKPSPPSIASSHQFQSKIWNKAMSTYSSSTSVFSQYLLPPSPSYSLPLTSTTGVVVASAASAPTTTLMDITTVPMIAIQHMKHLPSTTGLHIPVVVATGTTTTTATTSTLANLKSLQREHLPSHICSFNTLYKRKRVVVRGGGGAIGAISGSTSAIGPTIVHRQSKRRSEWWKKRLNRMRQPRVTTTTTTASKMKKISSSQKLSSISGSAHPHHYHPTTTTTTTTTIPSSSSSSSSPLHIHDVNNQVTRFDLKVKQTHLTLPLHKDHTQETITENKKEEEPLLDLGYLLGITTDQPESGLSLQLHVQYNGGDALLKLSTQLAVNFPCAQFLTVPIEITVSRLVFDAIICLTYKYNEETRTDQVSLYLKPYPNDDQSSSSQQQQQQQPVLKDFGFDIKMGAPLAMKHDPNYVHDPNENAIFRDTLNVIEPFVRSTLQRTLNQFVFPNRIRVDHVLTRSETDESKKTKIHVAGHTFSL